MNLIVTWKKLAIWAYQYKMQFNPNPNKQANEVILPRKSNSNSFPCPPVKFNENTITKCSYHKHLGIVLDSRLNFNTHIDQKIKKNNKTDEKALRKSYTKCLTYNL